MSFFPEEVLLWFNSYMGYLWIFIGIFFLFFELNTPGLFFFVSFALGAFFASALAFLGYSLILQCVGGLTLSLVLFLLLRKYLKNKKMSEVLYGSSETNIDALAGRRGQVIEDIEEYKKGRVKVGGEVWRAKSVDEATLAKGEMVTVLSVEGNTVIVRGLKKDKK